MRFVQCSFDDFLLFFFGRGFVMPYIVTANVEFLTFYLFFSDFLQASFELLSDAAAEPNFLVLEFPDELCMFFCTPLLISMSWAGHL